MPMKPHKGESQDDFMSRCVPEMIGTGDDKRPQDQAVAACLQIWRDNQKAAVDYADPGYQADGKKRLPLDTADHVRAAWRSAGVKEKYTDEQLRRIRVRIIGAWKTLIDPAGPPSITDDNAMALLRRQVVLTAKDAAPDPDEGESHDDFLERCVDEMTTNDDTMDEDDATEACQLSWDENSDRGAGAVMHKTHAGALGGMEFVLSDATPDRFGDIVEVNGWELAQFKRNPIALFAHDKQFPIGKWENLRVSDDDLRGDLVLAPKGTSPRIDEIRRLVDADILRAVSVGFRPLESAPINIKDPWGGERFIKHELVECSLVAVPANPNALAVAKSLNISPTTVRLVFGEHADRDVRQRDFSGDARRGEDADKRRAARNGNGEIADPKTTNGEHAETHRETRGKPMLLSKRIQDAERNVLALQDQLDKHLESIDDTSPTEEQMVLTEDLTSKIEGATRHIASLKAIETRNAGGAADAGEVARRGGGTNGSRPPIGLTIRAAKKPEPLDFLWRAAVVRCKSKVAGADIDEMRRKIYGDDEATRAICDIVLKAATAPAMTTVAGWAAELVQQIYADFMQVLLPVSIYPRIEALGLALSFGQAGRIIIPNS